MTVELAHPSTEPLGSRSPIEPAHPRWWFVATTPGRILSIGLVLAIPAAFFRVASEQALYLCKACGGS